MNDQINNLLYRKIAKGNKYNYLLPVSNCEQNYITRGDTKAAIDSMASWAKKHQNQTQKLALQEFANLPLSKLCKKLHNFLHDHLQYKIDVYDQLLRSPACSWSVRSDGLDCKSFTIFGSSILLNCGVSHFMRRVIKSQGEGYSHVYLIIPIDQKTYTLKAGYYCVDGTLKSNAEQPAYKSDDVFIDAKKTGLNSPVNAVGKLVNYAVDDFIREMESCSGSIYDSHVVQLRIRRDLRDKIQVKINNLIEAITYRNRPRIQHLFNDLFREIDLGVAHLRNETAYSQYEHCDNETLALALDFAEKLKTFVDNFYDQFKKTNKHYEVQEFTKSAHVGSRTLYFVVENATNPIVGEHRFIALKTTKTGYSLEPILPFEENPEQWFLSNFNHLKNTYKDGRELAYKKEILPLLNQVKQLREKVSIGGEMLYYFEQPIQRKMYTIWLKYDQKYTQWIKQKADQKRTANQLALLDYQERFKYNINEDQKAKKRKRLKKQFGYGALASVLLLLALKN